jgi:hypothetical protein
MTINFSQRLVAGKTGPPSRKGRLVRILAVALGVAACFAGQQGAAVASDSLPYHVVVADCGIGRLDIVSALAYGTVTYPQQEWVAWESQLQKWNGSSWVTVYSAPRQWFLTNGPFQRNGAGYLLSPWEKTDLAGFYRVKSRFYWDRTRSYSPWEYTAENGAAYCEVPGFLLIG